MVSPDNKYFSIEIDPVRLVVRLKRTSEKFPTIAVVEQVFGALTNAVKDVPKSVYALLLDLREGPLRNDEAFETAVKKYAGQAMDGWRKSAILVRSAVGELQLSRQARESGTTRNVFRDEAEALRFLES